MNILFLLSQLPESTGSGFYTRALIDQANRAGHTCSLVAACSVDHPPDISGIPTDDIHLVHFDHPPLCFSIPGMSDVMPYPSRRFMDLDRCELDDYLRVFADAIKGSVEKNAPDIIHSNHLWLVSALARRLFPDIPLVATCHGTDLRQFHNCPHLRSDLIDAVPRMDAIFALTRSQKKEIASLYHLDEGLIHVVPPGYDPDTFYPAPKSPTPPWTVLFAGKLSESKGLTLLLESLCHKKLHDCPIHLYVAGSGSGPQATRCLCLGEKLPGRVTFCGVLSPIDLGAMMRKAHVFVLPSFFEGLPLVLIEALASGCRIVSTDLPGIRELVADLPGDWGQLIDLPPLETVDRPFERDLPMIQDRLAHVLEEQLTNAQPFVPLPQDLFDCIEQHYSWERVFRRVEQVYQTLVSPPS